MSGRRGGWLIIHGMINDMNESRIRALDQVRPILEGTHTLDFVPAASPDERRQWVASVLHRFRYRQLKRAHRGLLLRYVRRFSGFSRAHMTRRVTRWMLGHRLEYVKGTPANALTRRYTDEDVFTLPSWSVNTVDSPGRQWSWRCVACIRSITMSA